MIVRLESSDSGVLLPVKAQPGARRNGVVGVHDGALKVAVNQVPEKGKANAAIAKVLVQVLGLRASQVELASGATNPLKKFLIRDLGRDELLERIEKVVSDLSSDVE